MVPDRLEVGETLARMLVVAEGIDHRHRRRARQPLESFLAEGAHDNGIDVTRQHPPRILDHLPPEAFASSARSRSSVSSSALTSSSDRKSRSGISPPSTPGALRA